MADMLPSWGAHLMHWFWRGSIAVVISVFTSVVVNWVSHRWISAMGAVPNAYEVGLSLARRIIPALAAVCVYGILTFCYGPESNDRETHCRKCGYILRGISEPRCSECGERI
jgi:hypothetical protein